VKAALVWAPACALAVVASACSSDNSGFNPRTAKGPDAQCVEGELAVGTTVSGDLSAATACAYPYAFDSSTTTLNVSYNFGGAKGKGYLISMQSLFSEQVTLVGNVAGVPTTLAYADYSLPEQAAIVFVPPANTGYSVRAGADVNNPADTGAFTLRAQSCKVPLPTIAATDSITHTDAVGPGDCTIPYSDYEGNDSSFIHIYQIQIDAGQSRAITLVAADSSLAYDGGGPGFDPFAYFGDGQYDDEVTNETFTLDTKDGGGIYTLVVGTNEYTPTSEGYTLTVGPESLTPLRVPTTHPKSARLATKMLRLHHR
jgi:hypothetical protein